MEAMNITSFITSISTALADFSLDNLSGVIVAGLTLAIPLVLAWFAFRWIYGKVKGALKKGS